jgi:hypothetical protein
MMSGCWNNTRYLLLLAVVVDLPLQHLLLLLFMHARHRRTVAACWRGPRTSVAVLFLSCRKVCSAYTLENSGSISPAAYSLDKHVATRLRTCMKHGEQSGSQALLLYKQ